MKPVGESTVSVDIGHSTHGRALQVICLGSGGGPCEDNVTGFLLRSASTAWARNSLLAVDAGSHLAPITRILERDFPTVYDGTGARDVSERRISNDVAPDSKPVQSEEMSKPPPRILDSGPFAGLRLPEASARANALHILRSYISAYLITHPHLDHLSGFAINTAAFHATTRPKTVAALPSTVDAMKRHIFNDVIWPNLTDEDGGVGFVTFQRLKEGGDAMVGEGEGRGYIEVCDGLGVRAFKVSHGVCTKSGPSHQHRGSVAGLSDSQPPYNGSVAGTAQDTAQSATHRSLSMSNQYSVPGTPSGTRSSFHAAHSSPHPQLPENTCVVDSTALFIRDSETSQEVLFFGDVEPDSLSLHPRNQAVWAEAARKIVHGHLGAILIECSYDDSQADAFLFGHLNPRHLVAELQTLAALVEEAKMHKAMEEKGARKRKQSGLTGVLLPEHDRKRSRSLISRNLPTYEQHRSSRGSDSSMYDASANLSGLSTPGAEITSQQQQLYQTGSQIPTFSGPADLPIEEARGGPLSPKSVNHASATAVSAYASSLPHRGEAGQEQDMPLQGVRIIIIHIKDTLRDGPHISESILEQLQDYETQLRAQGQGLGCEFVISRSGESYWV